MKSFMVAALLATAPVVVNPAMGDPLPEPLETQRQAAIELALRACDGEQTAFNQLTALVLDDNLPAAQSIAWLVGNEACPDFGLVPAGQDRHHVAGQMTKRLALKGYPIAQFGYGRNLMRGTNGIALDPKAGMDMLMNAAKGGYATAAVVLAEEIPKIRALRPQDIVYLHDLLEFAEQEGVDQARVTLGRAQVYDALYSYSENPLQAAQAIDFYDQIADTSPVAAARRDELTGILQSVHGLSLDQARKQMADQAADGDVAAISID
ncbi:hypothetical protein G5B38_04095 [Pseudohalocynthiibacter aestuariivivens]|nr:hypothetical protein [Pseudohalocynthiibacter aestuariivivens]QIE44774.1 hypothetical protein G5B38_04095 [Pseudohalocynthiibacter aestuariivivens]